MLSPGERAISREQAFVILKRLDQVEAQLRHLATQHTAREIARVLGRTKGAIKMKARTMGLKPTPSKR